MLLKPKNLEDLTVQLHALPKEKRNVIVLVGRHLNEGTLNLAVRHHKDWEKKGAVAVRIPPQWTPHGFYHNVLKAIRKGLLGLSFFRPSPEDSKVITHSMFQLSIFTERPNPVTADTSCMKSTRTNRVLFCLTNG
jgi:hypothetical protein